MTLKRYMKLYRMFISQYVKKIMQSKSDFFVGFIAFFLIQFGGIAFISLIFLEIPDLAGWSFHELLFIYGLANIPRGIDHMFADYIWLLAGRTIVRGEFDKYLLRPLNPLFQLLAEMFQPDGIGEVVIGIILITYSTSKGAVTFTPAKVLILVVMVIFSTLIYTSIKLFLASFAFWIKRSQSILYMFYSMSDFAKYPLEIYHKFIRSFITFVIPFAVTAYIPASYFLGVTSLQNSLGLCVGIGTAAVFISYYTFTQGIKRYESVGN